MRGSPSSRSQDQSSWPTSAAPLDFGNAPEAEVISRVEAMELARLAAEERARVDEEAWHEEELRLQEEEALRRSARVAREEIEQQREAAKLHAERDALGIIDDGGDVDDGSTSTHATAFDELLALDGNDTCFDCDASLIVDSRSGYDGIWWSATHGTFLCSNCAGIHERMDPAVSSVHAANLSASVTPELDVLYAGGNQAFQTFLAEEATGVPRRVWLALSVEARYQTPAADLYRRRLRALVDGQISLPTDLVWQSTTVAMAATQDSKVAESSHPPLRDLWSPPSPERAEEVTMTDYLTAMSDMRRRIEAAKERFKLES